MDRRRDPARSSATTAPIFEGRYGILPNGNAPFDPQHEFVNKNLLYTAQSIADIAKGAEQDADRRRRVAAAGAADPVRCARAAAPAAARRQGADRVERPDDRGVRARIARARRRARSEPETRRTNPTAAHLQSAIAAASFIRDTMWNADEPHAVAALSRRRCGDRRLRRGLRVPDLRRPRIVPGLRRSAVAGVGARAAGAAG